MRFDKYDLYSRLVPAILCLLPVFTLNYYFLGTAYTGLFGQIAGLKFVGGVTVGFCLIFLTLFAARLAGKIIESYIFKDGQEMPTTRLLTQVDRGFTSAYKLRLITKIKSDFDIDLTGEFLDPKEERKAIHEAVGQIRKNLRSNTMILQRNIYFGFMKNFIGGALLIGFPLSVVCALVALWATNQQAFYIFFLLSICYGAVIVLARPLLVFVGNIYAYALFEEYA